MKHSEGEEPESTFYHFNNEMKPLFTTRKTTSSSTSNPRNINSWDSLESTSGFFDLGNNGSKDDKRHDFLWVNRHQNIQDSDAVKARPNRPNTFEKEAGRWQGCHTTKGGTAAAAGQPKRGN